MKSLTWVAAGCLSVTLLGCQAVMYGTATDLNQLEVGMTKAEVISKMGTPLSTEANGENQTLLYKRMANVTGWLPTYYDIVLSNGKVVSFSERQWK